jgi:hypothetical protein
MRLLTSILFEIFQYFDVFMSSVRSKPNSVLLHLNAFDVFDALHDVFDAFE